MDDDEVTGQIERVLSPMMKAAVEHAQDATVDGLRLGIGLCVRSVDHFVELAPTLTEPEHVDAVVGVLRALAGAMREESARFSLDG